MEVGIAFKIILVENPVQCVGRQQDVDTRDHIVPKEISFWRVGDLGGKAGW